ncbi:MAG: hypothetical protein QM426_05625 [Euryarchaeota archaeon]|nr:hypothetical protein [Euryarchaeota archaeon]
MNSDKYTVQASVTAKTQTKSLNFLALGDGNTAEIKDIRECPLAIEYPVAEVTKRISSDLGTTETGKTHLNFAGTMLKPSYLKACYL